MIEQSNQDQIVNELSDRNNKPAIIEVAKIINPKQCENQKENIDLHADRTIKRIQAPKKYKQRIIENFLRIHPQEGVNFGNVLPGNICEENLIFIGLTTETLVVQVLVFCLNNEYDELDEYVFSIRKHTNYDYNDKLVVPVQGRQPYGLKLALKVPNQRRDGFIKGTVIIQAHGLDNGKITGQLAIPMISCVKIPQLTCQRMLRNKNKLDNIPVIMLAVKSGKKNDCKIPFRNVSDFQVHYEVEFLHKPDSQSYDLTLMPQNFVLQAKQQGIVIISVKQIKQERITEQIKTVIVLKIKNSTVHFSFATLLKIY